MATEIATLKLKPGKRPDDINSSAGQVLKEILNTLTRQKGFQQAYWGLETENPDIFHLFVDWDSINAHIEFTKSETYQPFLNHFGEIFDLDTVQMYHAFFKPYPASQVLSDRVSPSTEIGIVIFSSDISPEDQVGFADTFKQQCVNIANSSDKYTASAGGWVHEDVPVPGSTETGKAFVGVIGWHSMKDHLSWRETPAHDENRRLMEQYASLIKYVDVKHYSGTQTTA